MDLLITRRFIFMCLICFMILCHVSNSTSTDIVLRQKNMIRTIAKYLTVEDIIKLGKTNKKLFHDLFNLHVQSIQEPQNVFEKFFALFKSNKKWTIENICDNCDILKLDENVLRNMKFFAQVTDVDDLMKWKSYIVTKINMGYEHKVLAYRNQKDGIIVMEDLSKDRILFSFFDSPKIDTYNSKVEKEGFISANFPESEVISQTNAYPRKIIKVNNERVKLLGRRAYDHSRCRFVITEKDTLMYNEELEGKIFQMQVHDVQMVVTNYCAGAALTRDGEVFTFGESDFGGVIPTEIKSMLKNIIMIFSCWNAFLALKEDGNVVIWGSCNADAIIQEKIAHLGRIVDVLPTADSFQLKNELGELFTLSMRYLNVVQL